MTEEKENVDRFGWHPDEATVTLVAGVAELPDKPQQPAKKPAKKAKADRSAK